MLWEAMRTIFHPDIEDVALCRVLYALSDPIRLEVVRKLANSGDATCFALDAGKPKSTMSHHFRVLREAGLVHTRIEGPTHINNLRRDDVDRRFPGLLSAVLFAGDDT
ncbi:helix-turn-helix domain-containing protein [soil metagenome]